MAPSEILTRIMDPPTEDSIDGALLSLHGMRLITAPDDLADVTQDGVRNTFNNNCDTLSCQTPNCTGVATRVPRYALPPLCAHVSYIHIHKRTFAKSCNNQGRLCRCLSTSTFPPHSPPSPFNSTSRAGDVFVAGYGAHGSSNSHFRHSARDRTRSSIPCCRHRGWRDPFYEDFTLHGCVFKPYLVPIDVFCSSLIPYSSFFVKNVCITP